MAASGLIDHGWTYMNIDDAWQGKRGGPFNGIQGNSNFPDMKALCDEIHGLGLKAGIYSHALDDFLRQSYRRKFGKSRWRMDQANR